MYRNGNSLPLWSLQVVSLFTDSGNDLMMLFGHHFKNSLRSVSLSFGYVLRAIRQLKPGYCSDSCSDFATTAVVLPLPNPPPNSCILVRARRYLSSSPSGLSRISFIGSA